MSSTQAAKLNVAPTAKSVNASITNAASKTAQNAKGLFQKAKGLLT